MNIQAEPGNKVERPEGPREWKHRQQPVCPSTIAHVTRVRPLGATSPIGIGWIPHCGRTAAQSFAVRSESAEVNYRPELRSEGKDETSCNSQGNLGALDVLFSRYRGVLSFVAYRVLGDHNQAEDAVQRCLLSASWNVPHFETEGAFRSWLVRVLIDEALLILQEREWVARILRTDQGGSYPIGPEFPEGLLS